MFAQSLINYNKSLSASPAFLGIYMCVCACASNFRCTLFAKVFLFRATKMLKDVPKLCWPLYMYMMMYVRIYTCGALVLWAKYMCMYIHLQIRIRTCIYNYVHCTCTCTLVSSVMTYALQFAPEYINFYKLGDTLYNARFPSLSLSLSLSCSFGNEVEPGLAMLFLSSTYHRLN